MPSGLSSGAYRGAEHLQAGGEAEAGSPVQQSQRCAVAGEKTTQREESNSREARGDPSLQPNARSAAEDHRAGEAESLVTKKKKKKPYKVRLELGLLLTTLRWART